MTTRIYVRASTKDQDAERALDDLRAFAKASKGDVKEYIENESGTKLDRPILNQLLDESKNGDILLVESVDRLSRLSQADFDILKGRIKEKGLKFSFQTFFPFCCLTRIRTSTDRTKNCSATVTP